MPMRSPHAAHSRNGSVITHTEAASSVRPENRLHSTPGRTPPIRGTPPAFCGRLLKRFVNTPMTTNQPAVAQTTQLSGASIGRRNHTCRSMSTGALIRWDPEIGPRTTVTSPTITRAGDLSGPFCNGLPPDRPPQATPAFTSYPASRRPYPHSITARSSAGRRPHRSKARSRDRRLQTADGRRWKARRRTVRRNALDPPSELETPANPALECPSLRRRKSRGARLRWPLPAFQTRSGYIDAGSPIKGTSRLHRCCDRNGQKFSAGVWSINFSVVCLQLCRRARRRGAESESAACRELRLGPTAQCGRHCLPRSSA
jgi:hypothetical protein